jgi:FKBP12-rapamycin complex-associated protein
MDLHCFGSLDLVPNLLENLFRFRIETMPIVFKRKSSKKALEVILTTSISFAGLSPALTAALRELSINIPALKKEIADGLLKILSVILMQQPFRHPGTPKHLIAAATGGGGTSASGGAAGGGQLLLEPPDSQSVVLGLRTLGSFDFEGHSLLQFVRHCADTYLHSEEKEIRLEAVRTCSALLRSALQAGFRIRIRIRII